MGFIVPENPGRRLAFGLSGLGVLRGIGGVDSHDHTKNHESKIPLYKKSFLKVTLTQRS